MPETLHPRRRYLSWVPAFAGMTGVIAAGFTLAACSSAEQMAPPQATEENAATLPPTSTVPEGVRTAPVVPGRPGRVFIFAGVDKSCSPLPEPKVEVSKAAAKGDISFKPGQQTTITASAQGTCIGTKATGTGVYYTARAGNSGADTFSVTARLTSGETMTRDFMVNISE